MAVGWCMKRCGTTGCSSGLAAGCCSSWCLSASSSASELWTVSCCFSVFYYRQNSCRGEPDQPSLKMLFSDYGERIGGQMWTVPATKVVKPIVVSTPEKPDQKSSDWVINASKCVIWNKASQLFRFQLINNANVLYACLSPQWYLQQQTGRQSLIRESNCSQPYVRTAASGTWLTSPSPSLSWTASLFATNTRSYSARRLKWATRSGRKSSLCSMVSMNQMKVITMHMFAIIEGGAHKYQLSFFEFNTNWWSMTKIFRKLNYTLWLEECLFN